MANKHSQNHVRFHVSRMLLFGLLSVAILLSRTDTSALYLVSQSSHVRGNVLAYATNMSISDLLSAANSSRAANGLSPLQLNTQLNNSAQSKAQHMLTYDYWAHTAPNGTEPWYFFNQAGYNYTRAGENLAYGFNTGYEVNTGWMNSPTHRDNILGDFTEVGFGIASGAGFQGGENTVVVAHYGKPVPPAPAPAPTPPSPTPTVTSSTAPAPVSQTQQPTSNQPTNSEQPTSNPASQPSQGQEESTKTKNPDDPESKDNPVETIGGSDKQVTVLEQLLDGHAPTVAYASLGIAALSTAGYALTHRFRIKHLIKQGRKIKLHHTAFDIMLVGTALAMILGATVGRLL